MSGALNRQENQYSVVQATRVVSAANIQLLQSTKANSAALASNQTRMLAARHDLRTAQRRKM